MAPFPVRRALRDLSAPVEDLPMMRLEAWIPRLSLKGLQAQAHRAGGSQEVRGEPGQAGPSCSHLKLGRFCVFIGETNQSSAVEMCKVGCASCVLLCVYLYHNSFFYKGKKKIGGAPALRKQTAAPGDDGLSESPGSPVLPALCRFHCKSGVHGELKDLNPKSFPPLAP